MERRTAEDYLYGKTLVIEGWENLRANLRVIAEKYPEELGYALREEGIAIMEESMRLCPYDQDNPHFDGTLHLNDTGQVQGPYIEDGNITVALSYDTPYAAIQHEVQEYNHDYPEQWKYLESPLNARAPFIAANLARGVDLERMGVGYNSMLTKDLVGAVKTKSYLHVNMGSKQARAFKMFNLWESEL